MSFYVLHLLSPAKITKYRGFLKCEQENTLPKQIPLEDLRCIITTHREIEWSGSVLSALLEHKVVLVHCDQRFVPCGITAPLVETINPHILRRQISAERLKHHLWQKILRQKIKNQAQVLELVGASADFLKTEAEKKLLNEAAAARYYFQEFFSTLGEPKLTRRSDDGHQINIMLNYGYTVLQAMVHRSLVAHGLNPVHGLHHIDRFHAHALVYDLMEPWRPFLDLMLWVFIQKNSAEDFNDFKKYISFSAHSWEALQFEDCLKAKKMLYCLDASSASLSECFQCQKDRYLWLPEVEFNHLKDLLKWDGAL